MAERLVSFEEDRAISLQQFKRHSTIIERVFAEHLPCDMCDGRLRRGGYVIGLGSGRSGLWLCRTCIEALGGQITSALRAEELARNVSPLRDVVVRDW